MVERELNAGELDERVLLDLVRSTDRVGVLSIYIDAYSGAPDPGSRSWGSTSIIDSPSLSEGSGIAVPRSSKTRSDRHWSGSARFWSG
jgi:hypothetical protein